MTDPLVVTHPYPLKQQVPPGDYPVKLYFVNTAYGYRTAYAVIPFRETIADTYQFAVIEDSLLENPVDKTVNGMFPVDAGLLSFSDFQSFTDYDLFLDSLYEQDENGNVYDDVLAKEFARNANIPAGSGNDGDWINFQIPNTTRENIIMFSSGLGDGLYPAYFGLSKDGSVVCLVIDFLTLERERKFKKGK